MLKADKSRRIMLSSVQAAMVRKIEAERKKWSFLLREMGRVANANATRRVKNEKLDTNQVNTTTNVLI